MRLSDDDLKRGWLHPRRVVRNVVAMQFAEALTDDRDVTRHAIRSVQEFGWDNVLTWGYRFSQLPLAEEAAFEWVCDQVERTGKDAPSADHKWHLTGMLAKAEITLVERHRDRLLALEALDPLERDIIVARLDTAGLSPDECWQRIEDHCRAAARAKSFAAARMPTAELLLEPLVRAGSRFVPTVMEKLRSPPAAIDGNAPGDWLTGLMIILAGRLRIEESAPLLWELLAVDWDWYSEEVIAALVRIGTPDVVSIARERYPQSSWSIRLYAQNLFASIRSDAAGAAIEEILAGESDDYLRGQLGLAAAAQLDDRLVSLARAVLDEDSADVERSGIRSFLVTLSHLSGWDLPERDEWEREIDAYDDRVQMFGRPATETLESVRGGPFGIFDDDGGYLDDEDDDLSGWLEGDELDLQAPASRGGQVGRNETCPCGSGKKYKRCCLRKEPG
jgi:hypothetical protein